MGVQKDKAAHAKVSRSPKQKQPLVFVSANPLLLLMLLLLLLLGCCMCAVLSFSAVTIFAHKVIEIAYGFSPYSMSVES